MVIMELKQGIENPAYDGRKRTGWQSQKDFPAGTRFSLSGGGDGALSVKFVEYTEQADDQRLIVELLGNAGPTKAANWQEVAATLPWVVDNGAILTALFSQGSVNEQQLRAAAQEAHDTKEPIALKRAPVTKTERVKAGEPA